MIRNIKSIIKASAMVLAGTFMLLSCESEADNFGSQLFTGATGNVASYEVETYNIDNGKKLQADASRLANVTLGAFTEGQFGMQKSSYVTQVRLSNYAPTFGTNPKIDSVVLVVKPQYAKDSVTTRTFENYTYPEGNVAAKVVVNNYPITKYGKAKKTLTLNVHEVADFLGAASDTLYSNKPVAVSTLLGSKVLNGTVSSVKITKKSDNTDIFNRDVSLRIPLDKNFFQTKILAKAGSAELSDISNFIRYFKGIRLSVEENDGYLMKFVPDALEMVMYYKSDVTTNGTTTAIPATFAFNLGSGNTHLSQIINDQTGAAVENVQYTTNASRLYLQGMGGPGAGLRIPATEIAKIKELYKNQNIAILSANIRLYSDPVAWKNSYEKPFTFLVRKDGEKTLFSDMSTLANNGIYQLIKAYDLAKEQAYYDIAITQTLKDIVEKEAANKDIIINIGGYESNITTGLPYGQAYNTRAYQPHRIVLIGAEAGNEQRARLNITYTKK